MTQQIIALDASHRTMDINGFMHVPISKITKAGVNPYRGNEIPNWEELGLEAARIYYLLRCPVELEKGYKTFNNLPMLSEHVPIHSAKIPKEKLCGNLGDRGEFINNAVYNSLIITDAQQIKLVESGEKKGLSLGYFFTADMTSGTYEGVRFDGVMRRILGNHIALVKIGRAGADIVVGDAMPSNTNESTNPSNPTHANGDSMSSLVTKILARLTGGNFIAQDSAEKVKEEITATLAQDDTDKKAAEKIASDAADASQKAEAAKAAQPVKSPDNPAPAMDSTLTKCAMDAAISEALKKQETHLTEQLTQQFNAQAKSTREAADCVRPLVGFVALDSADEIFAYALKHVGVDAAGIHPSAYPAMVKMALNNRTTVRQSTNNQTHANAPLVMDSAGDSALQAAGFNLKTTSLGA